MAEHQLSIHPAACTEFNQQALSLRPSVQTRPIEHTPREGFIPDAYVSQTISTSDLERAVYASYDGDQQIGMFLRVGTSLHGVEGEAYRGLQKLAAAVQRTDHVRDHLSVSFVVAKLFEWLVEPNEAEKPFSDHILISGQNALQSLETWIPIADCYPQEEIDMGSCVIRVFSRQVLDRIAGISDALRQYTERKLRPMQGLGAVTVTLHAEPIRARERAMETADTAISVLRFFSPANIDPEYVSRWAPIGQQPQRASRVWFFSEDGFGSHEHELDTKRVFVLDRNAIALIRGRGLDILAGVLKARSEASPFEQVLLQTAALFGRGALTTDLAQRLLYQFAALEGLLLRNASEPVQQNLSERMAFFGTADPVARERLITLVKDAYLMRSQFVHHAKNPTDLDTIKRCARQSQLFIMHVIKHASMFKTKDAFLEAIDKIKFGAAAPPPLTVR
jgi:hypothetical protein